MEKILRFKAADGNIYDTEEEAEKADRLVEMVERVMSPLGPAEDCDVLSKGWIQHDPAAVIKAREGIMKICRDLGYGKHYPVFKTHGRGVHPLSIVGRVLCDTGGPLSAAWSRFCRIDGKGREHQQCYYAYTGGPDKDHVCVEDRRKQKRRHKK